VNRALVRDLIFLSILSFKDPGLYDVKFSMMPEKDIPGPNKKYND
jgi:hypothetical protein